MTDDVGTAVGMIMSSMRHFANVCIDSGVTCPKVATAILITINGDLASDKMFLQMFPTVFQIERCQSLIAKENAAREAGRREQERIQTNIDTIEANLEATQRAREAAAAAQEAADALAAETRARLQATETQLSGARQQLADMQHLVIRLRAKSKLEEMD